MGNRVLVLEAHHTTHIEGTLRTLQKDLKLMIDKGLLAEKATSPTDPTRHYVWVDIPSE